MPKETSATQELERDLSIRQGGTDRHQAGKVSVVRANNGFVDEEPKPPEPPPEPDEKPKPTATLRHP